MIKDIYLYNVLSHKKEKFIPINPHELKIYACGITVYDNAHIGHAYQSVVFDMITRYFKYKGYKVKYVRNYTDIDDKIINKANELKENPILLAEKYIKKTEAEMIALGNDKPDAEPRVTENIQNIINFIQKLIDSGNAYISKNNDVYFSIKTFEEYGKLSRIQIEENEIAVRKQLEINKIDYADFVLWKSAKPKEVSWKSPWGMGRPGWHIECSSMIMSNLGEQIDIHGGGRDLIFPHHENEIAQSESLTGKKLSNYWIHCGLVKVNGQKMSKSLGNGITLEDILKKYDKDTIRFALLRNNYISDINIKDDFFYDAFIKIYKMYSIMNEADEDFIDNQQINNIVLEFTNAMNDNFNTSLVFSIIFKYMNLLTLNKSKYLALKIKELMSIFNILQENPNDYINKIKQKILEENNLTEFAILEKIKERNKLKENKDFKMADKIREELLLKHIILKDTKQDTKWDIIL